MNQQKIKDEVREKIDQLGITLCYALFAYNDNLISEEIMNCYRDTFADEILSLSSSIDRDCDVCKGKGLEPETGRGSDGFIPCSKCKGTKKITHKWRVAVVLEDGRIIE